MLPPLLPGSSSLGPICGPTCTTVGHAFGPPQQQHCSPGLLGPASALYPSQPTSLPSAFSTMTLLDPTWNMDTGVSSYLTSNARNLSTVFNKRLFRTVHVGDGNYIPVTNTGITLFILFIALYTFIMYLSLLTSLKTSFLFVTRDNNCTIEFDAFGFYVNDLLTRHILFRRDGSGDLYPDTKPLTISTAFVFTSSSTWHQRLSHPGDEVLRSLASHYFISCNKEKSTHVCHACQLDIHVKRPFYSLDFIVKQRFDIIPSDLWTFPLPFGKNFVRSMWLFKHKFHANGTLSRYKARLVANDISQQLGVDFDETFSLVVEPATIRTVLSLVVSRKWSIHQLNVKNAFLSDDLSETVYMHQPRGFVDSRHTHHVYLLQRSLYRLKHAPRAWFQQFAGYATRVGFYHSHCDSSLFIYRQGSQVAYLLIYVYDIILTAYSLALLQQIIDSLHSELDMTDLRALNYFLGIYVVRHPTRVFLSQRKYVLQHLELLTWLIVTLLGHQLIRSPNWVRKAFLFRIIYFASQS
nr:ribonuclease H-like domain-containing protein [Tanacetum cinerariifolium]